MTDPWQWADEIGPEKVVHLHDAAAGLRAVVAIDNTAAGPSIGGVRMAKDVSAEEAFRLARAMTFKNAAAGLPHCGGKSVVVRDPHMSDAEKETLIRAFAQAIRVSSRGCSGQSTEPSGRASPTRSRRLLTFERPSRGWR